MSRFKKATAPTDEDEDQPEFLSKKFSGTINKEDMQNYIENAGLDIAEFDLDELFREIDAKNKGSVQFQELLLKLAKIQAAQDQLAAAFKVFDRNKDGYVEVGDLKKLVKKFLKQELSDAELVEMAEQVDIEGNGKFNFETFSNALVLVSQDMKMIRDE